ncbi:MAG TPA: ribose-phosphate pyrophosphokinase [Labilithrix sp.]|nr:ribose-phosphate pyrophosphokinase [Labilithrix sp.]
MSALQQSTEAPPNLVVLAGSAHPALGSLVARELGLRLGGSRTSRFPDGEIKVEIDDHEVAGEDVAIVQPTPSGSDALLELLLIADACHRVGAATIFAIVPYFGYARQDARKHAGLPLGVRVAAKVLAAAPFERLVTVDPHSDVLAASLEMPMDSLSAVPLLVEALEAELSERDRNLVVVAPDLGAMRLAREYARLLRVPMAVVHKVRTSGTQVSVERIAGDVQGRQALIVDDMISTGGTVVAAARALRNAGIQGELLVAATHAVFSPGVIDRLREADVRRIFCTDTIASSLSGPDATVVSVAPLLATCIRTTTTRRRRAHFVLHP